MNNQNLSAAHVSPFAEATVLEPAPAAHRAPDAAEICSQAARKYGNARGWGSKIGTNGTLVNEWNQGLKPAVQFLVV